MVIGYKSFEFYMFGLEDIEYDLCYAMVDEFVMFMKWLWIEDENLIFEG